MENKTESLRNWLQGSAFLRVLFIGFVILLLQIPIAMVSSQIYDRQMTRNQAHSDITSKWGERQTLLGPRLVVPYYKISRWKDRDGVMQTSRSTKFAVFLPESLFIDTELNNEIRYRGLFKIPVYQSDIILNGSFTRPDFSEWDIDPALIQWKKAQLIVGVSDTSAIQKQVHVKWNNKSYKFEPGLGKTDNTATGFHVPILDISSGESFSFNIPLKLNGSGGIYVAPMGEDNLITMKSDWPDPSFTGYKLPNQRHVSEKGFRASWSISYISRNYPQQWLSDKFDTNKLHHSLIGVDFLSPVDNYRMTQRSIKYVMLFLVLTFVSIWLIEVIAGVRVHLLQYTLIGLGMILFYLLLLALSEHIGFIWAYVSASGAVILMTSLYSKAVLKTTRRAGLIGAGITILYIYLFTLLQEENYSMLFGSVGVFLVLAAVMYVTRNIDWYNLRKSA